MMIGSEPPKASDIFTLFSRGWFKTYQTFSMNKDDKLKIDLRQKAEERLASDSADLDALDSDELKQTIHELKVHQIELELQNEELRRIQSELASAKDRYFDLYHNAPVGHATIDDKGVIQEANTTLANMLGVEHSSLYKRHFFQYVRDRDRGTFLSWMKRICEKNSAELLEVGFIVKGGTERIAQFYGKRNRPLSSAPEEKDVPCDLMMTIIDTTEKWRWHRQLEESNIHLNRAIEVGNLAWWHMDVTSGKLKFHRKKTDMLGYEYDDFKDKNYHVFTDLLHPEDEPRVMQAMRDHLEGRAPSYSNEYRIRSADGTYRWFRDFGKISERNADGTPKTVTGIVVDITDRRNALMNLQDSERKYRLLAEHTQDLVCLHQPDGTYEYISPSVTAMLGYDPETLVGKNPYHFFHPDDIESIQKESHEAALEGKGVQSIEYRFRQQNGSYVWLETYTQPVLDDTGKLTQLVTSSRDVSDRRRIENTLEEERNLLNSTFNAIQDGIIVVDEELSIIHHNETMRRWTGKNLKGLRCRDAFRKCPDSCTDCLPLEDLDQNTQRQRTIAFETADGAHKTIQLHSYPLTDNGKVTGMVQFAEDITAIVEAKQALERSEERWRTVFEKSYDGIVLADQKTARFRFANTTWLTMTGYDESDLGKIGLLDIHPPDEVEKNLKLFEKAKLGEMNYLPELTIKRKNGQIIWVELAAFPIGLDDGDYIVGFFRDISRRKEAQWALERSQALSRLILDGSPDATYIIDREKMQFVDCNDEACHALLMDRKQVLEIGPHDIKPGYSRADLEEKFDDIINHPSQTGKIEAIHQRTDGTTYPVEIYIRAAQQDNQTLMVAAARDISERIKSDRALRESEERYAMAQQVAKIGSWEWNIQTGSVYWTDGIYRLFGRKRDEFDATFEAYIECIHPEDRQYVTESITRSFETGEELDMEHRIQRPDGTVKWVSGRGGVTRDESGKPLRMLGMVQDITNKKRSEQQTKLLSYVVEHSPFLIIVTDPKGDIEYVNPKFIKVTGYTPQEVIGENPRILKSGETPSEDYKAMWDTIASGKEWSGEIHNKTKYGHSYWAKVSISPIFDEKEQITHYVGIQEDISSRKQMELDLIKAKEEAEQANQAKSTFLASMSHEVRTPLNSILGFSQILKGNKNNSLTDKELKYVNHILGSGNMLLELINDVLDLSKIESGKFDLNLEPVPLSKIFVEAIDQVGSLAGKHQVSVRYVEEHLDRHIRVDERGIKQVLINLLSNAIKYNREQGEVVLSCRIVSDRYAHIEVADTGPGIPEDKMEALFQPFNRLGAETTKVEGTGIGLTITKRLVDMMKGDISVKSDLGIGTTFSLIFPLCYSSGQSDAKAEEKKESFDPMTLAEGASEKTVLYVEDNRVNLELMKDILGMFPKLTMLSAETAEEGIELAKQHLPDAILMDINLPGMDGYEAQRRLKEDEQTREIPVIAVTAKAMSDDRQKGIEVGFVDYITKPIDVDQMGLILKKVVFDR